VGFPYPFRGEGKVVKVKNVLEVPMKLVKLNMYMLATLQPGDEVEITVDPETVRIELKTP
jgi:hypothetical protein